MLFYYDRTFPGFCSALFDAFARKNCREIVILPQPEQPTLLEGTWCEVSEEKFERVTGSIRHQFSERLLQVVYEAWLSHRPKMDTCLFQFLKLCYHYKQDLTRMMQVDTVQQVILAARYAQGEAHRMLGLLRFRKVEKEIYLADMEPECELLPLVAEHFADRFAGQSFVIRDFHYRQALFCREGQWRIVEISEMQSMESFSQTDEFEEMWRVYYKAMTIQQRKNYEQMRRCMPKKYWVYLPEKNEQFGRKRPLE